VCQRDWHRHELRSLVCGVAEHHALVAGAREVELVARGAITSLVGPVDALREVRGLLVHRDEYCTVVPVESVVAVVVTDAVDSVAHDLRVVQRLRGGDLIRQHHHPGGDQRFARHTRVGIIGQCRVGDRVGDLVGVPLGH
jgi:hypothetical protein